MTKTKLSFLFNGFLLLLLCYAAYSSLGFLKLAKPYPLTVSILGVILTLVNTARLIPKIRQENIGGHVAYEESEYEIAITHDFRIAALNFLWFLAYSIGIFLFGFYLATIVFVAVFLKTRTDFNWFKTAFSLVSVIAVLLIFNIVMRMNFPQGLLLVHLWPLNAI